MNSNSDNTTNGTENNEVNSLNFKTNNNEPDDNESSGCSCSVLID